jgi:hypothetical protein
LIDAIWLILCLSDSPAAQPFPDVLEHDSTSQPEALTWTSILEEEPLKGEHWLDVQDESDDEEDRAEHISSSPSSTSESVEKLEDRVCVHMREYASLICSEV